VAETYSGWVDIVIPIWRESPATRDCITAVIRNTEQPFNLILVSSSESYTANLNQGLTRSKSTVVVIMDDDVIVPSGGIRQLAATLLDRAIVQNAAAVIPKIVGAAGLPLANGHRNIQPGQIVQVHTHQASGCCAALLKLGANGPALMDDLYLGSQWGDTDYFRTLEEIGYTIWMDGGVVVNHVMMSQRASNSRGDENRKRYHEKWPPPSCGCCDV